MLLQYDSSHPELVSKSSVFMSTYRGNRSGSTVLCGTKKKVWLPQVLVNLVGDGNLGVGKGLKRLLVRFRHFRLDVVKEERK